MRLAWQKVQDSIPGLFSPRIPGAAGNVQLVVPINSIGLRGMNGLLRAEHLGSGKSQWDILVKVLD